MAVSSGGLVLAAEYNSLQNRVATVLGNGVNTFGYGQPVTSSQVSTGAVITASRLANVREDLERIYTHQTGDPIPLNLIVPQDIIAADTSGGDVTKGFNDYLDLITTLESNRFDIDATQQDVTPSITSDTRNIQWSYITITSEFTATFTSSNARRHFFNSGGEIRIAGSVTNLEGVEHPSYPRNKMWQDLVQNPGTILFGHNYVQNTLTGATGVSFPNTQSFGNYQLDSTYKTIFRKDSSGAGGVYGSVYENSYWMIQARNDSDSVIRFRVSLVDTGPESGPIEEPVTADITYNYGGRRADNPATVNVAYPTYTVVNPFQ